MICCCRHRPAPGEVIYRALGWSTNAIGHRWGVHIRVEHRKREGQCAHVPSQGYGDIDASIERDREGGLLVTEVG